MKKKLSVKCWIFYWLCSIVSITAAQHAGKMSLRYLRNLNQQHNLDYFHHKTQSDMKFHIMKVLNMRSENSTLDRYVSSLFNLNNLNPTYIFRLPDKKNRTLVFRKSDFTTAVFPNITNVNKFTKSSERLQTSSSSKHQIKLKNDDFLDELKHERNIFDNNIYDDYEEMKKIVEENVRSEKDFIKLMTELNEDLNEEDYREKYHQSMNQKKSSHKKPSKTNHKIDEWEEFGLNGWSGAMVETKKEFPKREKPKSSTALATLFTPFDQLGLLRPIEDHSSESSQDANIKMEEISDHLSSILLKDEQILLNKTGRLPNKSPRWPITTTRDQHGDNDIFLARANNPFGHSTKWKYNNISDVNEHHREVRSKRDVFNLYSMIKCATGCDPLIYKGYGCYCGFLGSGRALDGIDRCCKAHDYCYNSANCFFYTEYFVPYLWKCYRGKPLCAIDNGEWGGPGSCATRLCQCDLALSKCLRHYYCPKKRPVCVSSPFRLLQNLVMVF